MELSSKDFSHDIKAVISTIIDSYINFYQEEFESFTKAIRVKQDLLKEQPWGKFQGRYVMDYIEEPLVEYPVTLFNLLKSNHQESEFKWFQSKEGSKWLGRKYPAFKLWRGR